MDLAVSEVQDKKMGIRAAARLHSVNYNALQRRLRRTLSKPGRKPCLLPEEEKLIVNAALWFADNGTPLSKEGLKDAIELFVKRLQLSRRTKLPFKNGIPGKHFIDLFVKRTPALSMRRRANLERARADAMSPCNVAVHFARLRKIYREFKIKCASQIFNIDESGFSTRKAGRGRAKAIMRKEGRSNSVELSWSQNADHVTLMPVVSADGSAFSPIAILPGCNAKFRIRSDNTRETPSDYLPPRTLVSYRNPAGMDSCIF